MPTLAITVDVAFVLTAEVEKDPSTASGYRCAAEQMTQGGQLYGEARYRGVAAMTRLGFAKRVIIVGGQEMRYPEENITRSLAFKAILEEDMGAVGTIDAALSTAAATTMTSLEVMRSEMARNPTVNYVVVTSYYHAPRTQAQLFWKEVLLPVYPAEAFILAECVGYKEPLIEEFGGGPFANRVCNEISGVADLLMGRYK